MKYHNRVVEIGEDLFAEIEYMYCNDRLYFAKAPIVVEMTPPTYWVCG